MNEKLSGKYDFGSYLFSVNPVFKLELR